MESDAKSDTTLDLNHDSLNCVCCQSGRQICELSDVIDDSADLFDSYESNTKVE